MKTIQLILTFFVLLFCFTSCKKEENLEPVKPFYHIVDIVGMPYGIPYYGRIQYKGENGVQVIEFKTSGGDTSLGLYLLDYTDMKFLIVSDSVITYKWTAVKDIKFPVYDELGNVIRVDTCYYWDGEYCSNNNRRGGFNEIIITENTKETTTLKCQPSGFWDVSPYLDRNTTNINRKYFDSYETKYYYHNDSKTSGYLYLRRLYFNTDEKKDKFNPFLGFTG